MKNVPLATRKPAPKRLNGVTQSIIVSEKGNIIAKQPLRLRDYQALTLSLKEKTQRETDRGVMLIAQLAYEKARAEWAEPLEATKTMNTALRQKIKEAKKVSTELAKQGREVRKAIRDNSVDAQVMNDPYKVWEKRSYIGSQVGKEGVSESNFATEYVTA